MSNTESRFVPVGHNDLRTLFEQVLRSRAVRDDVSFHLVESLLQTSLRGVDSHGIELFPHYVRALDAGRINPLPDYRFEETAASTATLDADHTFGHAAGAEAMLKAVEMAGSTGIGAVAVYNSSHFGAAAYFALLASTEDMIGLSFTHADSLMLSYNGVRPFFGTNPICFSAPAESEEPFCLDMATSLSSWNKLQRYADRGERIPVNWAYDEEASPTDDPEKLLVWHPSVFTRGLV